MVNKQSVIWQILDLARWAPSGDNTQPWRFEIINEQHVVVHGHDTRHWCVYDLQGHASQLALGGLLETITIAASTHGLTATEQRRLDSSDDHPIFDVHFSQQHPESANPLIPYITSRSVQRRPMRSRPLTAQEKEALEDSVGSSFCVRWLEGWGHKLSTASLLFNNAKLRLTIPEAHAVHKRVIEWGTRYSADRMPGDSIGLDPIAARLSSWLMKSWRRVDFFNTYLAGTWIPRIELDLVPALACGAHFVIANKTAGRTIDDYVAAGRAMQRFWLKAESLGLRLQPEMTPLIFSAYAREKIHFSNIPRASERASRLAVQLSQLIGEDFSARAVFMGRIGSAPPAKSRSLRLPLDRLMHDSSSEKNS